MGKTKAGTFDRMPTRRREEVLNVLLAQCICDTGLTADPENILNVEAKRKMPDILVYLHGLRCSIDGKYADHANYREELEGQVFKPSGRWPSAHRRRRRLSEETALAGRFLEAEKIPSRRGATVLHRLRDGQTELAN